jgi:hypothetical protein
MKISQRRLSVAVLRWLDPVSKIATIAAVVMAGIWTYYIADITGETELNPEVLVRTQVIPYSHDTRVLVARVSEENVGWVPVNLDPNALTVTVKRVPATLALGVVDMDKEPITYQRNDILKRYGGEYLEARVKLEDLVSFVVAPGLYQVEATLALPDGDMVNGVALQQVQ